MANFSSIIVSTTKRNAIRNGPITSNLWNDTTDEIIRDLGQIRSEWNNKLIPAFSTIPDGTDDLEVDAFKFGLAGDHIYVDAEATASTDLGLFYNVAQARPRTIKEGLVTLSNNITDAIAELQASITDASTGITEAQQIAIGARIFGLSSVSSATSLDGLTANNQLNVTQLGKDLYSSTDSVLQNSGDALLAYSVKDIVHALLALHEGSWTSASSIDIDLTHLIDLNDPTQVTGELVQTRVDQSSVVDDTYTGTPTNLLEDLNQVRYQLKRAKGSSAWTDANTVAYIGGPISVQTLIDTTGSLAQSTVNPWGYSLEDIPDVVTYADAAQTFTGMSNRTDSTPAYSSTTYVSNDDSLETSIGMLDASIAISSGLVDTHTSDTTNPHSVTAVQADTTSQTPSASTNQELIQQINASKGNNSVYFDETGLFAALEVTGDFTQNVSGGVNNSISLEETSVQRLGINRTVVTTDTNDGYSEYESGRDGGIAHVRSTFYDLSHASAPGDIQFQDDSFYYDDSTERVGIFNTAPGSELHVAGSIMSSGLATAGDVEAENVTASGILTGDTLALTTAVTTYRTFSPVGGNIQNGLVNPSNNSVESASGSADFYVYQTVPLPDGVTVTELAGVGMKGDGTNNTLTLDLFKVVHSSPGTPVGMATASITGTSMETQTDASITAGTIDSSTDTLYLQWERLSGGDSTSAARALSARITYTTTAIS